MVDQQTALAEVIASNTRSFSAEVYRGQQAPAFGSWVCVQLQDSTALYGLVSHIEIDSIEPNRRAVALGKTTDELRREMPHVLELLRTTFRAQVLAYRTPRGHIRQTLPPHPADIHAFVAPCDTDSIKRLRAPYDYLRTLVQNPDPAVPVDALIIAVLQNLYAAYDKGPDGTQVVVDAGRVLSRLMNDDHERLEAILRNVMDAQGR